MAIDLKAQTAIPVGVRKALALPVSVSLYGAIGNGVADETAAFTAALAAVPAGGRLFVPDGTYLFGGSFPAVADNVTIAGQGAGSILTYAGSGEFIDVTGEAGVRFENLKITGSGSTFTLLNLDGTFRCSFAAVLFVGAHTAGTAKPNQTGVTIRGNSGDNRFIDCEFQNLGTAIKTDSTMNYLTSCVFATCQRGVWGDSGSFGAGMSAESCTFVSSAAATTAHVQVDVDANKWWFTNCWFEGCTTGLDIGSGTDGPYSFGLVNCSVNATTDCVKITAARQTYLANVHFGADAAATPTELTIHATNAAEGVAVNLLSTQDFSFADADFPASWSVLNRDNAFLPATVVQSISGPSGPLQVKDGSSGFILGGSAFGAGWGVLTADSSISAGTYALAANVGDGTILNAPTGEPVDLRINNVTIHRVTASGLHWIAANEQTTVGAAGGASALPATPTKFLKVVDSSGTLLVIPAYAAS